MNGFAPVSHQEIESCMRLTGRAFDTLQVEAIKRLDAVIRHPETDSTAAEPAERKPQRAWPTKKAVAE